MKIEGERILVTLFDLNDDEHLDFSSHPNFVYPETGRAFVDGDAAHFYYGGKELSMDVARAWVLDDERAFWIKVWGESEIEPAGDGVSALVNITGTRVELQDRKVVSDFPTREGLLGTLPVIDLSTPKAFRKLLSKEFGALFDHGRRSEAVQVVVEVMDHHLQSREVLQFVMEKLAEGMPWSLERAWQMARLEFPDEAKLPVANELKRLNKLPASLSEKWIYSWRTPLDVVDDVDWHINIR